jgi:hypothetical protein
MTKLALTPSLLWFIEMTKLALTPSLLCFKTMCQGWLIGTDGWKRATAKALAGLKLTAGIDRVQARQLKEARWGQRLTELLEAQGRGAVGDGPKNQPWKLEIALRLRTDEGASAAWLAQALQLGTPATARSYLSKHRLSK